MRGDSEDFGAGGAYLRHTAIGIWVDDTWSQVIVNTGIRANEPLADETMAVELLAIVPRGMSN
ncbi:hypothetical protein [Paenibacillus oryzisoli]|uniref:Uncharacterized protein n=1 Tax=Paenibacillus oryzisoli TaxID=1850517 RepID=A0A198AK55_9BACL|nr:hypothetical protein [Paenibacillus oryzisoli]OAS21421.1 hypothetical protein A8708_31665 [Paenibacillus oryzisoli]